MLNYELQSYFSEDLVEAIDNAAENLKRIRTRGRWREGETRCPRKELVPRFSDVKELCRAAAMVEGLVPRRVRRVKIERERR